MARGFFSQSRRSRPVNARNSLWKQARMTWILVIANVLWYLIVETLTGKTVYGLAAAGAVYGNGVLVQGQWYRLFSAMFVHMSLIHITLNMVSLASLYVVEIIIGSRPFAFLYVVSGLAGNLLGLWTLPGGEIAGGASGAIFGIFAAALVLSFKGFLTKAARNQLVILLVINLVYGFSNANIDMAAHIGGLLAGIVITLALIRWRRHAKWFRALGIVSIVVTGIALLNTLAVLFVPA